MENMTKKCCLFLICAVGSALTTTAQESLILNGQDDAYQQAAKPTLLGNYQNNTIFVAGQNVMNLRGGELLSSKKQILSLAVNPAGNSFAVVKEGEKKVEVYDLWKSKKKLGTVKLNDVATTCCFTPDGTRLAVADAKGQVTFFRLNDYRQMETATLPSAVNKMGISPDGSLLAASDGNHVVVIGMDDKGLRADIPAMGRLSTWAFSNDSKELAVLTNDGQMNVLDTRTFSPKLQLQSLGEGRDCKFHPDGKYVAAVTGDSRIVIINMIEDTDRKYVEAEEGGVTDLLFAKDERGGLYMVYNTASSVHYKLMNELPPYLTKLLEDEVQARMAEWEKRMPEETDEQYMMRVNDETRAAQMRMFEDEIATRMAAEYGTAPQMSMAMSNYNPETNMMALDFEDMAPIYINVPKEELRYFMNPDDIELRNPVYGVGKNDKFELLYADVYNKQTGKSYTYDNRSRQSLDYLKEDNNFMPLDVARQGAMDEMALDEMKNEMVTTAKVQKKLSEHTKINVSTKNITETDAQGKRHMNYKVSFDYAVDAEFSGLEDFAPGQYKAEQSAAAQTMLSIINQAMQKDFARYVQPGKKVKIVIKGSADAAPIKKALTYKNEYGEFTDAPVIANGEATTLTVNKKTGIRTNEELAFLRAMGMKDSMEKGVKALKTMITTYETQVEQAEGVGGEFRRIFVDYIFEDAF
jgi:hypothetical protein